MNLNSIRTKLILFFLIMMFVPSILINTVMYNLATETLVERKINDRLSSLSQSKQNIDNIFKNAEHQLIAFINNEAILEKIEKYTYINKTTFEITKETKDLWKEINDMQLLNPNIEAIFLYDDKEKAIISSSPSRKVIKINDPNMYHWITIPVINKVGRHSWNQTVTYIDHYARPVRAFIMKKQLNEKCQIAFLVNERLINYNYLNTYGMMQEELTFIMDETGRVLSSFDDQYIGQDMSNEAYMQRIMSEQQGYLIEKINHKETLVVYTSSNHLGWKYISMIPMEYIELDKREVLKSLLIINMISIALAVVLAFQFTKNIYKPIYELKNVMKKAGEGNFSVQIHTNRKDEFKILYHGFNQMITRMNKLIKELLNEKLLHKEAELKNLQSQVDPHFLYNTLDSIHWMARLNRMNEVSKLTFSLSNFYKLCLSGGKKYTTIRETVELINQYLIIKKIRYGDCFNDEIKVEEGLEDITIPHLLIQPIIENAIYHGIEKKSGANSISIHIYRSGENIIFEIKDDGQGMTEERLKEVTDRLNDFTKQNSKEYSILVNIQKRVQLHYGSQYGLQIKSQYGEGTVVTLTIPYKNRDNFITGNT